MRSQRVVALVVLLVAGTGCLPVPSLHPFVTEEQAIAVPGAVGEWADSNGTVSISRGSRNTYTMSNPDSSESPRGFRLRFARIGGRLFADVTADPRSSGTDDATPWLWPMHTAFRVDLAGDSLRLAYLEADWVKEAIEQRRLKVRHESTPDGIVLTESTSGLQVMLRKLAGTQAAFGTASSFRRRR
jgi:hypothetical protein